jgi:hypothetical protein
MPGQQAEKIDETQVKTTVVKDGDQIKGLGGSSIREVIDGEIRVVEAKTGLFMAANGQITTTDLQDLRYPHVAGKDYMGNLVADGNLNRCREKGCNRMVSNQSGVEYKPGLWRCTEHYKKYDLRQFFKWLLSPFYHFEEVEETPDKPINIQGVKPCPPQDQTTRQL